MLPLIVASLLLLSTHYFVVFIVFQKTKENVEFLLSKLMVLFPSHSTVQSILTKTRNLNRQLSI